MFKFSGPKKKKLKEMETLDLEEDLFQPGCPIVMFEFSPNPITSKQFVLTKNIFLENGYMCKQHWWGLTFDTLCALDQNLRVAMSPF